LWLSVGNARTETIAALLSDRVADINAFDKDREQSLLPLELKS
jgi:hypothetical protein